MGKCIISEHCLFEKSILLNKIRVSIHYLPFHPVVEISLEYDCGSGIILYSGKFEYRRDYASFLDYFFSDDFD